MSKFLTEQETEQFLETQSRTLTLPDGKAQVVRGFNLMWLIFDDLQAANMFTQERLIEIAYEMSERESVPFAKALESICSYAHQQVKNL